MNSGFVPWSSITQSWNALNGLRDVDHQRLREPAR